MPEQLRATVRPKGPHGTPRKWQEEDWQDAWWRRQQGCREKQVMRGQGVPWDALDMGACQVTAGNAASQGQQAREWNRPAKGTGFQDAEENTEQL